MREVSLSTFLGAVNLEPGRLDGGNSPRSDGAPLGLRTVAVPE
jgi:hypothetical protein